MGCIMPRKFGPDYTPEEVKEMNFTGGPSAYKRFA